MGIKWENIKVLNSPLSNNIYLGKLDKTGMFASDKSSDRTKEVIAAVMNHMDKELKGDEFEISYKCEVGTLTWKKEVSNGRV